MLELLYRLVRELDLPLFEVFYPDVLENSEIKNILMKKLSDCSDYEINVILSVVKSLQYSLRNEGKSGIESEYEYSK